MSKSNAGTTWEIYATSLDGTAKGANTQTAVGMGTLTFDGNGNLSSTTNPSFTIDRSNTGAQPTVNVSINFVGSQAAPAGLRAVWIPGSSRTGSPAGDRW